MVSTASLKHFQDVFPDMAWKMDMIPDMISPQSILQMAKGASSYTDDYIGPRILTVARLNKEDKGYDITLEACRILKERNIKCYIQYTLNDYEEEKLEKVPSLQRWAK